MILLFLASAAVLFHGMDPFWANLVEGLMKNIWVNLFGPHREKTCLQGYANNKGADQHAHPRRLISAFVIPLLESIISRLATSEISIF